MRVIVHFSHPGLRHTRLGDTFFPIRPDGKEPTDRRKPKREPFAAPFCRAGQIAALPLVLAAKYYGMPNEVFLEDRSFSTQRIYELAQLSTAINSWTAFQAAEKVLAMGRRRASFAAERVNKAAEAFRMFAVVFGYASPNSGKMAA